MPGTLLGMLLFISSELMFFGGLFGAYGTIRAATGEWPPPGSPDLPVLRTALFSLGVVFLAGQGFEYRELWSEGFGISTNVFTTLFFTMTGFHGLHVLGGLLALALVAAGARRGEFSPHRLGPVEAVSYYWHFVDVVWVLLFTVLYIIR